ncbi:saccharopine dehydrogenase NADP-binding domain-containing protein [Nocardia sp. NPDC059240]|uniref:saccharopine dehydrogenase NADP-binding domain-containing protein n=1 Tax=Nocardia sp. NPDC059240 TaxID=3346786 RepID=UPI00369239D4
MFMPGRVLVVGLGAVSRSVLPLLFRHLRLDPAKYTVLDCVPAPESIRWVEGRGAQFLRQRVTSENYREVLRQEVAAGDLVIDLACDIDTVAMLDWCHAQGVRYINTSVGLWDERPTARDANPAHQPTVYARHLGLRAAIEKWGGNGGPTAIVEHGANPGLMSHFVKTGLDDIADEWMSEYVGPGRRRERIDSARRSGAYNHLAELLRVRVIHLAEHDTQISADANHDNEFANTWCPEELYREAMAPSEIGWGTHECLLPLDAISHRVGPRNQILLTSTGRDTRIRSWVPSGAIDGMAIAHGDTFSISEHLTVDGPEAPRYRPTVCYAYRPCGPALASLAELGTGHAEFPSRHRIMTDDVVSGRDELGCLIMGHDFRSRWTGSLLDIDASRDLVAGQNATTVQVAAGVLAAVQYAIAQPRRGVLLADDVPHRFAMDHATPYLGPFVSQPVPWTPPPSCSESTDAGWQFNSFLITPGAVTSTSKSSIPTS